ncbi:8-oxo-dGTP diphosphatase [Algoriphagus aquaeductus]|uniref:8-oxo-dGTP diphosphatase n=1 Tax=Algoriphagus aquaeductus TaxID=475299 RepID=A0A326RKW2_9BACT|nr:(deoxy)nucleoside triphosphate pyrophosphohydrolase [Algoriphagus aquaeductus]PZV79593.1 8-oxo-dGTP diphosphatase [Algoriphagus aquaeductus]
MKIIPVTCAIIIHQGKVLLAQRSEVMDLPGKWEFPGGKVEMGEDPKACLIREIGEELGIQILIKTELTPVDFDYPTKKIRLIPFVADWTGGEIILAEHAQVGWYDQNQLFLLDLAPADIPIVHELTEKWVNLVAPNQR